MYVYTRSDGIYPVDKPKHKTPELTASMEQQSRAPHEKQTMLKLNACNYVDVCTQQSRGTSHAKPTPLSESLDTKTQEALITYDLLYALLGHEGSYTKFSERYNPNLLHDRIQGPDHKVAKYLDVGLKTITKKLLRYAKWYSGLTAFARIYNHPLFGKVNQRLCEQIRALLGQYRQLVMNLEHQFNTNPAFSLRTMDIDLSENYADKLRHMYEIACLIHSRTEERSPSFLEVSAMPDISTLDLAGRGTNFDTFLESIKSDIKLNSRADISTDVELYPVCKGGLTLRVVQNKIYQFKGDPVSSHFLTGVFEAISQDYLAFLNLWLSCGDLTDLFSDFFIKRNELPRNFFYSNMEKYWQELYVIKSDGVLDQFESKDVQAQILLTGKYLNIIRQCTNNAPFDSSTYIQFEPAPIESLFASDLALKISQFFSRANSMLLKLLFDGFYLGDFVREMQETFLLADSSKVDNYLTRKLHELTRSKTSSSTVGSILGFNEMVMTKDDLWDVVDIKKEDLHSNVDVPKVLRRFEKFSIESKSFYEISEEILNIKSFSAEQFVPPNENASSAIRRIVTQSLKKRPDLSETEKLVPAESFEDAIIAGVNIDVNFPFPLNLIFSESVIFEYQLMFKFQMILKFTAKLIDGVWLTSESSSVWKDKNHTKSVRKLILRSRVLILRMKNFLNVLENHVGLNVVDANFSKLLSQIEKCRKWASESRPNSANGVANTSNFLSEDTQFLMSHGSNNNDVFDQMIARKAQQQPIEYKAAKDAHAFDLPTLTEQVSFYLSNTLRDSMITDGNLLQCVRKLLNEIVDYASTVSRLKKSFVLMNESLLREYLISYPERFGQEEISETLIHQRVTKLNEILTWNWSRFNNSLGEFIQELQNSGAENPIMQSLAEKLALV